MQCYGLLKGIDMEWPMLSPMFDTPLFCDYSRSLVRMMEFAALLEPDHPCLIEEARIFRLREIALRDHIKAFKSVQLWDEAREAIRAKLRSLSVMSLKCRETDDAEVEEAVLTEIGQFDFSGLFVDGEPGGS